MKRWLVSLFTVAVLTLGIGAHCNPTPPVVTNLLDCTVAVVQQAVPDLVPIVASILASGGLNPTLDAALIALAARYGYDVIDCVIIALEAIWQAPASQPAVLVKLVPTFATPQVTRAQVLGQHWLATRGQAQRTVGQ